MNLKVHWLIENVGHRPSEKSVILPVSEIVDLAKKMKDEDVIYTYHVEKQLDRMALFGTDTEDVEVSIQGHGGCCDKTYKVSDLEWILNNFEDVQRKQEEYGFKPDWE